MLNSPMPPITPQYNVRTQVFGLIVDEQSENADTKAPSIQIRLIPNLFTSPPIIGLDMNINPTEIEPISPTCDLPELKYVANGSKSTPNTNSKPPEITKSDILKLTMLDCMQSTVYKQKVD